MTGAAAFACVGDDRQLPATILSRAAKLQGLDESLFERFLRSDVCIEGSGFVQLDVQRRMHSSIAQFPSGHFYAGSVSNGCNDKDRPPIPGLRWPNDGNSRVLFVDCSDHGAREEQCGTSIRNFGEAELLVKTLVHLLSAGDRSGCTLRPAEVACITGYAAQRELLKQHLLRSRESVRVDTVDGFQGMERELVLVSSTRANETGEVGFMRDRRRANVLLTRARRGLIVFGDYRTMRREPEVWAPWLVWVYRQGCYVTSRQLSQMLS
jgi:superfamily I DNA and/or RNA helicase